MPPSPVLNHDTMIFNLYDIFKNILDIKKFKIYGDTADVLLDGEHTVMPDFKIVGDFAKIADGKNIKGAPDFIAEVLSPSNSAHDLITKRKLYEKHGVPEYWIIDINNRSIYVYTLKNSAYGDPDIYHCFTPEEIQDIEQGYDDDDKEQIKIKEIATHVFGEEIRVPIAKLFENMM